MEDGRERVAVEEEPEEKEHSTSRVAMCENTSRISTPSCTVVTVTKIPLITFCTMTSSSFTPVRNLLYVSCHPGEFTSRIVLRTAFRPGDEGLSSEQSMPVCTCMRVPVRCLSKVCSISFMLRVTSEPRQPPKHGMGFLLPSDHLGIGGI